MAPRKRSRSSRSAWWAGPALLRATERSALRAHRQVVRRMTREGRGRGAGRQPVPRRTSGRLPAAPYGLTLTSTLPPDLFVQERKQHGAPGRITSSRARRSRGSGSSARARVSGSCIWHAEHTSTAPRRSHGRGPAMLLDLLVRTKTTCRATPRRSKQDCPDRWPKRVALDPEDHVRRISRSERTAATTWRHRHAHDAGAVRAWKS